MWGEEIVWNGFYGPKITSLDFLDTSIVVRFYIAEDVSSASFLRKKGWVTRFSSSLIIIKKNLDAEVWVG
jgi:hypothetical protein